MKSEVFRHGGRLACPASGGGNAVTHLDSITEPGQEYKEDARGDGIFTSKYSTPE